MSFTLLIHEEALTEIQEAVLYYELQQQELGDRFLSDWEDALVLLAKHPLSFQRANENFRQLSLQKFPYMIIYEIEGKIVNIYKLICSKSHPDKRYKKR